MTAALRIALVKPDWGFRGGGEIAVDRTVGLLEADGHRVERHEVSIPDLPRAAFGVKVPDDLSLVGYDDIPLAKWVSPRLTTVRQPLRRMAEEATKLVIQMGEAPLESVPRMDLATNLIVRDSTAPPPTT